VLRPDQIGSGKLSNPSPSQWFDPSAFTVPTGFGNSGRNFLRGPRFFDLDLSLGKSFRIRESMSFEVRADAYNAFNHPQFNNPDTSIVSATAGQITSSQGANNFGPGRIFQMGGRFSF